MKNGATFAIVFSVVLGFLTIGSQAANPDKYGLDDYELDTAKDLYDVCTVPSSNADHNVAKAFCVGFFEGGIHLHDTLEVADDFAAIFCAPDDTSRKEVVDVFVAFAQANPQYHSEAPMDAVFRALVNKWPCDK